MKSTPDAFLQKQTSFEKDQMARPPFCLQRRIRTNHQFESSPQNNARDDFNPLRTGVTKLNGRRTSIFNIFFFYQITLNCHGGVMHIAYIYQQLCNLPFQNATPTSKHTDIAT